MIVRLARSSVGARRARLRRPVNRARFATVSIPMPDAMTPIPRTRRVKATGRIVAVTTGLALLGGMLWWSTPQEDTAAREDVFVFEDIPAAEEVPQALPDPSPPPPRPAVKTPKEPPPPQFGMQEEQLGETGDLGVATGNTLMIEADSAVRAPMEALPHVPQIADQAPRILRGRAPEYPARALERRLEVTVVVIITIDTLGRVNGVEIERSGGRDFDPGVVRAVRQLVFQPPVQNGRRRTARFRQSYEFRLQ